MRILLFYVLLFLAQGLLTPLFAPLPAPDLFLIAVLTLIGRVPAWQYVVLAFGVGLVQDLVGFGALGAHAFALAAAAMAATLLRAQLTGSGFFERLALIIVASSAKWLALTGVLVWVADMPVRVPELVALITVEGAFNVVFGSLLIPWGTELLKRSRRLKRELL